MTRAIGFSTNLRRPDDDARLTRMASVMSRWCVALAAATILVVATPSLAADRYTKASVDEAGTLRITTGDGRVIVLPKEPEQVDYDRIAISSDGCLLVGWRAIRTGPRRIRFR